VRRKVTRQKRKGEQQKDYAGSSYWIIRSNSVQQAFNPTGGCQAGSDTGHDAQGRDRHTSSYNLPLAEDRDSLGRG